MDNEFADLEAELLRLTPRRPGVALENRVADSLDLAVAPITNPVSQRRERVRYTTATSWSSWKWANWTVAASLVAFMAVWTARQPVSPVEEDITDAASVAAVVHSPELRPFKAGRTLIGSRADGVVELADGSTVERVRDYYVDTIVWRDPAGHSQLRWDVPQEAVRYVGLAAY